MKEILRFEDVHAGYGRIEILHGLGFSVEEGEVCGVIGPNGSGKSTMFNALLGLIRVSRGKIFFAGRDVTGLPPHARCRIGMGRTFQIPRPFSDMSVYENVLVAAVHGAGRSESAGRELALSALRLTGLYEKRAARAGELALLDRKRLEIARAIGTEPRLLLFDEVAAGLTEPEVEELMGLVRDLKAAGHTILWIEHVLETMARSTDHLICMAEGRNVLYGKPMDVIRSKTVEELYLGVEDFA